MIVIKKRGARCECCGAAPADGVTVINVDHVLPRKTHPELALVESNLQVLCHVCNHGKGNWDTTDWRPKDISSSVIAEAEERRIYETLRPCYVSPNAPWPAPRLVKRSAK